MAAKSIVIDTSVASAATEKTTLDKSSKNCCDVLKAVLDYNFRLVMTPEIKDEWNKHQSTFSRKWRLSMIAKKRLDYLNIGANESLRARIDTIAMLTDKDREAMWKDYILIEAAIATDKIIISRDEKARTPFHKAAIMISELKAIAWVNPDKPEEDSINWLRSGANLDAERLLGFRN
jgi:hypothetical protein